MGAVVGGWVAAAVLAAAPGWRQVAGGEVQVYTREVPGQSTAAVRAVITVDATPAEVRAVLEDPAFTRQSSPHLKEFRTVARPGPREVVRYGRVSFPFFEDRDYFIDVTLERDLDPRGGGSYRSSWKPWGLDRPSRSGVVRSRTSGAWEIEPVGDGSRARVTYEVACDPGGALPGWAVDLVQKRVVPDLLRTVRAEVLRRRTARLQAAAH